MNFIVYAKNEQVPISGWPLLFLTQPSAPRHYSSCQ